MTDPDTLATAHQLLKKFGPIAERIAADRLDKAMEDGDAQAYDNWCLVAFFDIGFRSKRKSQNGRCCGGLF